MNEVELEAAILAAHAALECQDHPTSLAAEGEGDARAEAYARLAQLYFEAATHKSRSGKEDAAAFLMTHAYVFALDAGDPLADTAHAYLRERGREA